MKGNKKQMQFLTVCISIVLLLLSACGKTEESVEVVADAAEVEAENEIEEPAAIEEEEGKEEEDVPEEIEEEKPLAVISYSEENKLKFCKDIDLTIQGTRADINNEDDIEQVDAEWIIKSIDISEPENGFQTITIQHECIGYLWTDQSNRFLFNISMPSARYCDLNTGKCFPTIIMSEDGKMGYQTMVEWDGLAVEIDYTEGVEWNDGTEWTPDGKGGYTLPSTMCITDTFVVSESYEGLGMILSPLTLDTMSDKSYGVHDEQEFYIHEILAADEGSVLFDMMDIYKILKEDSVADDESNKENSAMNTENPKENSTITNNSSTTPKQDDKKEQQSTHTHSYTSSVTKNPTCTEEGVRTYTCSCGNSYVESIPAAGHQWITTTETISHPSTGHFETVTETTYSCMNMNVCGYNRYGTWEEFEAHCKASEEAWEAAHADFEWDGTSEQVLHEMSTLCTTDGFIQRKETKETWIVDSEGCEETVTVNKCSVCGINQ